MDDSIFRHLIDSLPPDPKGVLTTVVIAFGIGVGALTALLGAMHSRTTISLIAFSLGALLGASAPETLGLTIDRAVTITAGGIIFGLAGFLLHRVCVAIGLGTIVAAVAVLIAYDQMRPIDTSTGLVIHSAPTLRAMVQSWWDSAPVDFKGMAPWIALIGFAVPAILGLIFPKFAMAAFYSLGGTLLTLFCIRLGHESDKISWLDSLKSGPMTIAALGMAMLLVGFVTQIVLLHRPAAEKPSRQPQEAEA